MAAVHAAAKGVRDHILWTRFCAFFPLDRRRYMRIKFEWELGSGLGIKVSN